MIPARLRTRENGGRLLAIDLGSKRIGIAVCDELRLTVRPVATIERRSWKALLSQVSKEIQAFEARGLVIGSPAEPRWFGRRSRNETRHVAAKFALSLNVPVYLQDERLTSEEAKSRLSVIKKGACTIDSEAAAIILQDFIEQQQSFRKDAQLNP